MHLKCASDTFIDHCNSAYDKYISLLMAAAELFSYLLDKAQLGLWPSALSGTANSELQSRSNTALNWSTSVSPDKEGCWETTRPTPAVVLK